MDRSTISVHLTGFFYSDSDTCHLFTIDKFTLYISHLNNENFQSMNGESSLQQRLHGTNGAGGIGTHHLSCAVVSITLVF